VWPCCSRELSRFSSSSAVGKPLPGRSLDHNGQHGVGVRAGDVFKRHGQTVRAIALLANPAGGKHMRSGHHLGRLCLYPGRLRGPPGARVLSREGLRTDVVWGFQRHLRQCVDVEESGSAFTFERHLPSTKLYCLVTEAGVRECCARKLSGWDSNPRPHPRTYVTYASSERSCHFCSGHKDKSRDKGAAGACVPSSFPCVRIYVVYSIGSIEYEALLHPDSIQAAGIYREVSDKRGVISNGNTWKRRFHC